MTASSPDRRCKFASETLAYDLAAIAVCNDKSNRRRDQFERKIPADRKQELVAMLLILEPLPIGAKIGGAGFDLDHPNLCGRPNSYKICAASRGERNLIDGGEAARLQNPNDPTAEGRRARVRGVLWHTHSGVIA